MSSSFHFWWVESSDNEALANMKMVASTSEKVTFPVLQNTKTLKPFDRLVQFKAKDKKAALSDAKRIKLG